MSGQTLIEVLIALAIAVIVVTAIITVSISSLNNAQYIKDQSQATKYAQEGSEIVRKIRNSNYDGFKSITGTFCLGEEEAAQAELGANATDCSPNIADKFIRSVKIDQGVNGCSADVAKVTVTVAYSSGKCSGGSFCHKSELVSCLSTVNPIPAP